MSNDWTIIDLSEAVGDDVVCDLCNAMHDDNVGGGGMLGFSTAFCPDCMGDVVESSLKHNEAHAVTLTPPGVGYNRFIRDVRRDAAQAITAARLTNRIATGDDTGIEYYQSKDGEG